GAVYALHASSGQVVWRVTLGGKVLSVAVGGGVVYAGTRADTPGGPYALYALRASDGKQLWRFPASSLLRRFPTFAQAGSRSTACFPLRSSHLHSHRHLAMTRHKRRALRWSRCRSGRHWCEHWTRSTSPAESGRVGHPPPASVRPDDSLFV